MSFPSGGWLASPTGAAFEDAPLPVEYDAYWIEPAEGTPPVITVEETADAEWVQEGDFDPRAVIGLDAGSIQLNEVRLRRLGTWGALLLDSVLLPEAVQVIPESRFLLDRRIASTLSGVNPTFNAGVTTWTLPYSVATDGSEGVVQVVTDDGEVLTTARPTATTVVATGDYSAVLAYLGIVYTFQGLLSTIYYRNVDHTGIPRADSRDRLQLQRIRFTHEDTRQYDVVVHGLERPEVTYPFAPDADESGSHSAAVLSNNEQVTITVQSPYPFPVWLTGFNWDGEFKTKVGLR